MFSGFEKVTDSSNGKIEQTPQISETPDIPSMDDLKAQLDEVFPMPPDVDDRRSEEQMQDTVESHSKEVTLDDGTVVALPSPPATILHNAETVYNEKA